jgi:undecaprenyl diphosphate synthase
MKIPNSVGVIIDGNRRWAKARGLPTVDGHTAGKDRLKECTLWAKEAGIKTVIVYAFSTENWKRAEEEVSYLFELIRLVFSQEKKFWNENQIRVRFIGQVDRLPKDLQQCLKDIEEETKNYDSITFVIALSYGGRAEIVDAAKRFALLPVEAREVADEEVFKEYLWTHGVTDPDLIVRTGGEKRLSNFLLWQMAYSELFFSDTLWPDFSKEEFLKILEEYSERDRRHGK